MKELDLYIDASLTRLGMDYVDVFMRHYFDVNNQPREHSHRLEKPTGCGADRPQLPEHAKGHR